MIKSLLIANRGEIACRIIRTVAAYSDADVKALHPERPQFGVFRM
jgi:3-methylcrotonyl-CoA carboxylase alpha subunit